MLERFPAGWCVTDLGSSNGTWVNGERIWASRRLRHGDEIRIGQTRLVFRDPLAPAGAATEVEQAPPALTARERDVLVALCRPLLARDMFTEPASTRAIADELVITQAAVKQHLANLYDKFGIAAGRRRTGAPRLANEALRRGAVSLTRAAPVRARVVPERRREVTAPASASAATPRHTRSGDARLADRKPILARRQGSARRTCLEGKVGLAHRPPHWPPLAHGHAPRRAGPSTHRPHRAVTTKGVDMLTTTIKRTIATALSGAAHRRRLPARRPRRPRRTCRRPDRRPVPIPRLDAPAAAEATPDAGLDLSSAAIGAASGTGLLIVVLAAGGLAWRRPIARPHRATRA